MKFSMIRKLLVKEEGQTLAEYGLFVVLIAIVVIAILVILGEKPKKVFVQVTIEVVSTS